MRRRLAPIAALGLVAGCVSGARELDEAPDELVTVYCEALLSCGSGSATQEECEALLAPVFTDNYTAAWTEALDADRALYLQGDMQSCLAQLRELGCSIAQADVERVCAGAFIGTVEPGEPCAQSIECRGDAYCHFSGGACPGECRTRGLEGDPCLSHSQCSGTLLCSRGACTALESAPCDEVGCPLGQVCEDGACVALEAAFNIAEGDPCDILAPRCEAGLSCAYTATDTWTCAAAAESGDACTIAIPDQCPDGEFCVLDASGVEGTCMPRFTEGDACSPLRSGCASGYACVAQGDAGVCLPFRRIGEACAGDAQCYSHRCEGTCLSPVVCEPAS